ncbi:ATP-dependent translocase ABCB1-like [Physella acuta]|uniref:ATP-dependent translocase ABCB1-like n=1 Tax=Physella acuta TaxID=109671 RepID=UPI0027DDD94D|nr:ATP-dependent translocase ABCB1-like [Physella acuta]
MEVDELFHGVENGSERTQDKKEISNGFHTSKSSEKIRLLEKDRPYKTRVKKFFKRSSSKEETFRFADTKDVAMMVTGFVLAVINGAMHTLNMVLYGQFVGSFVEQGYYDNVAKASSVNGTLPHSDGHTIDDQHVNPNGSHLITNFSSSTEGSQSDIFQNSQILFFLGFALSVCAWVCGATKKILFTASAQRQVIRLRKSFFSNILVQEIAWFDDHKTGDLSVRMTEDVNLIYRAIETNIPMATQWFTISIVGIIIAFIFGWKLSLVMLCAFPILMGGAAVGNRSIGKTSIKEREAYARAGVVAEQAFSNIRTVVAFGGEEMEAKRYHENLKHAQKFGVEKGIVNGLGLGILWSGFFLSYALGFYYGGQLIRSGEYTVTSTVVVFFSTFLSAVYLGYAIPATNGIYVAMAAAVKIYRIINKKSQSNSSSAEGKMLPLVTGEILFQNIYFSYPSRPGVQVLSGIDLHAPAGQTVALVGASGSGKSTMIQLLLRFYNPKMGQISLDDHDIESLNLRWLRQHIGLVSQEPVLFATTIAENIRYGLKDASMEDIIQASKMANAYDFIMKLPNQFETYVGEQGAQLSGGQKQRIAIARALVKDPKILLLDEATSALDTESEAIVQDALDKVSKGRTTFIVAHRLSTIRNADKIVTLSKGRVVEVGTHTELMDKRGVYYNLVSSQVRSSLYFLRRVLYKRLILPRVFVRVYYKHVALQAQHLKQTDELNENDQADNQPTQLITKQPSVDLVLSPEHNAKDNVQGTKSMSTGEIFLRLIKLNSPEWIFILFGTLASIVCGAVMPLWSNLFAQFSKILSYPDKQEQETSLNTLCLLVVGLGILNFIGKFLQEVMFCVSGESLTTRLRDIFFRSSLRQKMSWFDDPRNATGVLTTRLATEASRVQEILISTMGLTINSVSVIVIALGFAFYYSWKMALIILAFAPIVVLSGRGQMILTSRITDKTNKALEEAVAHAFQTISNIRTVAALTLEQKFYQMFASRLEKAPHTFSGDIIGSGTMYGFFMMMPYFSFCVMFECGALLVQTGELLFYDMIRVFSFVTVSVAVLNRIMLLIPDTTLAKQAAETIFAAVDRAPSVTESQGGSVKLDGDSFQSAIQFTGIRFRYPMRKEVQVLNGLDLEVRPGQTLALVGGSGCGKSTIVQLIERFYDAQEGSILLDNHNILDLNVQWLRMQIGLVSQEPILFDRSLAENIAYGDNTREVGMEEIIEAARTANIHTFIQSLPSGYETNVGNKGTQLSGGQKQRVAIARTLLRNPKILLLDEATSALDTESEKVVLEALDKAREGRTCITIAHRLSTIRNADRIAVLKKGVIQELGTHEQLMASRGALYRMMKAQAKRSCDNKV